MSLDAAVWNGPGRALYEAHRAAHNSSGVRVGAGSLPRWKALKPKTMQVWNQTAVNLGSAYDNPHKYGQHVAKAVA